MLGKCRACEAKDKHLAHLEAEVALLRKLALPQAHTIEIPLAAREADSILSGSDEPIEVASSKEQREFHALVSGSYDQVDIEE